MYDSALRLLSDKHAGIFMLCVVRLFLDPDAAVAQTKCALRLLRKTLRDYVGTFPLILASTHLRGIAKGCHDCFSEKTIFVLSR